jgi:hypothetical protein
MSRPDAVMLNRHTSEIEIMSFKTIGNWDARKQSEAQHDTQGLSESWAVEGWMQQLWDGLQANPDRGPEEMGIDGELFLLMKEYPYAPKVSTVRMEYLLRGERRQDPSGRWVTHSPLIRGYHRETGGLATEYAWSGYWSCSSPHAMRKSSWYRDGRCPGDGRRHKLPDDYEPLAVWEADEVGGVAGWIEMLASGRVQPEAGDALQQQLILLPPFFRHQADIDRWCRQASAQEAQVAQDSWQANDLLKAGRLDDLDIFLDQHFPMHTRGCDYPTRCQFQDICWNPEVARDPLASGLFAPRHPHHELERERHQDERRKAA